MRHSSSRILYAFLALFAAWILAIAAAPAERTLGGLVRWVYAHASLTQVSLLLFLATALLALGFLVRWTQLYPWLETTGRAAFGLWLLGFILSMIPARLSWGVWVDFGEPRTQMTLRVLAIGALVLLLALWVNHTRFTAVAYLALAGVVLYLNRNTSVIRHPMNPIGQAENPAIPLTYGLIFLAALGASVLAVIYLKARRQPA